MSRRPNVERYRQVVAWQDEGRTCEWMAAQLGIGRQGVAALAARARQHFAREAPPTIPSALAGPLLETIDQLITDGLRIQAEVVRPLLESVQRELQGMQTRLRAVEGQVSRLDVPGPDKAPPTQPPPALWQWVAVECVRAVGVPEVARRTHSDVDRVTTWTRGTTPSSKSRDALRELLATLWARELFVDFDELADKRADLPNLQSGDLM
jgi:hypothetical protein